MNRYLLFTFDDYYPSGGWNDFRGSFTSIEDAIKELNNYHDDYAQIVDSVKGIILERYERVHNGEFNNYDMYDWKKYE